MKFLSVCSGIEAASCAWNPLGMEAVAVSEIEPFPSAALAHHYPAVPNLGDMTKFKEWPDYEPDILVGGTPCQSFSVAGLRKGLADPRGNLMLTYLAIADRYQPEWIVWENVPGVLSSGGGRDFGTFLGALGALGYGWAYRTLDAQYFGVPQRRRRVFVVGHLGDWQRAAAVLFERHSLQGHPAPRRETGKRIAPATGVSTFECGGIGSYSSSSSSAPLLRTGADLGHGCEALCMSTGQAGAEIGIGIGTTLNCNHEAPIVTHSLRGEDFDVSEDGTGRGTPLVPIAFNWQDNHAFRASSSSPSNPLRANQTEAIALQDDTTPKVSVELNGALRREAGGEGGEGACVFTKAMQVRRLTPRECERLQGFPDDYTKIPLRNSKGLLNGKWAKDGPRYKALGNSMAVPVMRWIGERLQMVDWLMKQ